jgi:hypothetical protein
VISDIIIQGRIHPLINQSWKVKLMKTKNKLFFLMSTRMMSNFLLLLFFIRWRTITKTIKICHKLSLKIINVWVINKKLKSFTRKKIVFRNIDANGMNGINKRIAIKARKKCSKLYRR